MARRKVPKYRENPFLEHTLEVSTSGYKPIYSNTVSGENCVMVGQITGELKGSAGIFYRKEVDKSEFVKLYAEGVGAIMQLKSPGKKVFQLIYEQLYGKEGVGKIQIVLVYDMLSDEQRKNMSRATFFSGINENLKHNIIAETYAAGVYFINPAFIFNGDRLAIVKEYVVKKTNLGPFIEVDSTDSFEAQLESKGQQKIFDKEQE
ncbi:MAG: replication protein [Phascolarctobacterium sp.]|nr:replication protein [Phascolarctobacterium sp.]